MNYDLTTKQLVKMSEITNRMIRRKSQGTWFIEGPLYRCMNLFDLTILGLGGMVDAGIYVVIGQLALIVAGPAVLISFLIAATAAMFSGLCYAELSSRITKTGSGYVFTYVILGEVWAFVTGWSMVAEYLVNGASLARAFSLYIDSFFNGAMISLFKEKIGWGNTEIFGDFPNFPAFGLVILAAIIVGIGVRESRTFTDVIMTISFVSLVCAIIAGAVFSDPGNWSSWEKFAPNGIQGILSATPGCYYCMSGFDAIPTASEEAMNPRHDVPRAIIISLVITIIAYSAIITILTLMVPYTYLSYTASLAEAFKLRGFVPGYYIVSIGALCAMFGSLLATTYAVTRLFYSLGYDGLISSCIAKVGQSRHIPTRAVIVAGFLTGILALCIKMHRLIELVSLSTILTYTMVSTCVVMSRFQTDISSVYLDGYLHNPSVTNWLQTKFFPAKKNKAKSKALANYQKISQKDEPMNVSNTAKLTSNTQFSAMLAMIFLTLCLLGFWVCVDIVWSNRDHIDPVIVSLLSVYGTAVLIDLVFLFTLPRNNAKFPFMVPMAIPILSIVFNTFILAKIHWISYLLFFIWVAVGIVIYMAYGFTHSTESHSPGSESALMDFAIIPVPLPTGTEVIRPVQRPLPYQENPFSNFDDYDPEEWTE